MGVMEYIKFIGFKPFTTDGKKRIWYTHPGTGDIYGKVEINREYKSLKRFFGNETREEFENYAKNAKGVQNE